MMKIKTFKCDKITDIELQKIEKEVNDFTTSHNTVDVKVTSCCNSFGWVIIYCVIYNED